MGSSFFADQCVDDTGKQAARLQRWIFVVLVIYLVHIGLSFYLTTVYRTSLIGPIFSIAGLMVGIGALGSYKRDHNMTCVYIGVLAIELVIGIIGTALWVVEGVVIKNTTLQVVGGPQQSQKTAMNISITLAVTIPIVILINLYCLIIAAKLKMALKEEKKLHHALEAEEKVQLMVEELLMQHMNTITAQPQQHHHHHHHHQSSKKLKKDKQKAAGAPSDHVSIEMQPVESGSSAM